MIHFTVGTIDKPTSLLGALRHFGVSSTLRRRIKHNGICTINGASASTRDFVHTGDVVTVSLPEQNKFTPEPIPFGIAYEDEYLLVVDKPAGLLMHPTSGAHTGTLANAVAYYYQQNGLHCAYHPMHRLDKNTSGLCMIAKEPQILLLDEPTTYLDIHHQLDLMELVVHLYQTRHIIVIMVMHDLNHAARYSQRLVAVQNGRIVADGPVRDVFRQEILEPLYGIRAVVTEVHDDKGSYLACFPYAAV